MRKKLFAILGAIALLIGLGMVAPQQAQAYPLTGTHNAIAGCDQNPPNSIGHQQVSMNYTVTDVGPYNNSPTRESFSVQVNSATFTGPTAYYGVTSKITLWNGTGVTSPSWLSIVGGGANGPMLFPQGTAQYPGPVTRTNGVGGVSWSPVTVSPGLNEKEIFFYIQLVSLNNQSCKIYFDMSQPDGPVTGATSTILHCETSDGMANDLNLSYTLEPVTSNTYFFEITNATYVSESGHGPSGGIDLQVTTDNSTVTPTTSPADSGTANWTSTPALFVEADGQNGVNFPTKTITYTYGGPSPLWIAATFKHTELGGTTETSQCSTSWLLDTSWTPLDPVNGPSGESSETINFNDCRPGVTQPNGHLTIDSHWQYDYNDMKVRPVNLSIHNDSSADLKFLSGTSSAPGGLAYVTNVSPFQLSTMNSIATLTERTLVAGATKTMDISSPWKWSNLNSRTGHSDPVNIYETVAHNPFFEFWPLVTVPMSGASCDAGTSDLTAVTLHGPGPN